MDTINPMLDILQSIYLYICISLARSSPISLKAWKLVNQRVSMASMSHFTSILSSNWASFMEVADDIFYTGCYVTLNIRSCPIFKKWGKADLKNWRPISLLCADYKIIRRALNFRMGKVLHKSCPIFKKCDKADLIELAANLPYLCWLSNYYESP